MNNPIRVAVFRPNEEVTFEDLQNDLESMQKLVGGYIENLRISQDLHLVCNEEGKLQGLPPNRTVASSLGLFNTVTGTFFVTRESEGNYIGIQESDEAQLAEWKPGKRLFVD